MEKIVEHIISITNVAEKGNVLAYKILCNQAINMVLEGKDEVFVINYIDGLLIDLDSRKIGLI